MPGVKIKGKHQNVVGTLGPNREVYLGRPTCTCKVSFTHIYVKKDLPSLDVGPYRHSKLNFAHPFDFDFDCHTNFAKKKNKTKQNKKKLSWMYLV